MITFDLNGTTQTSFKPEVSAEKPSFNLKLMPPGALAAASAAANIPPNTIGKMKMRNEAAKMELPGRV